MVSSAGGGSQPAARTQSARRTWGLVAAIVSALAFAASGPFAKPLIEAGWSAAAVVIARVVASTLILLPFVAWSVRRDPGVLLRRWLWILAYGLLGVAGVQLTFYLSIERLPVGVALLLQYLAPVLLLLAAWARTRIRPAALALIGAALAIAGLWLVLDLAGDEPLDPLGVVFGLLGTLSLCAFFLLGANAPDDLPATGLIGGGVAVGAVILGVGGAVGLYPVLAPLEAPVTLAGAVVPWWLPLAVVTVFGTVIGYLTGVVAARRLGSRLSSFLGLLEVVATVVMAAGMLGEIPTAVQLAGGSLILLGVVCVRLSPDHARPVREGGVPDVVGTVTGAIPLPSRAEEQRAEES